MNSQAAQAENFDALVLGAGQAGGPLAGALSKAGWNVALVETKHVGGTCVNEGCTPTKTMIASARVAHLARRAKGYGVQTGEVSVDLEVVRKRKRDIVASFRQGSQRSLERLDNLTLLFGEARFTGEKRIAVETGEGTRDLSAGHIFINVGTRPRELDLPGLDSVPYLNSTTIMELGEVPEHLLVLGGGYVGLEFAQMFRRFGSRVTIVQRAGQLLPREDSDVAEAMAEVLRNEEIDVHLDTDATSVNSLDGRIQLVANGPSGNTTLTGTHLLVAAGRIPNSDTLDLAQAGIEADERGYVIVDDRLKTNVPGVYALGDIKGGPAFTHISYDDYRIARDNLLKGASQTISERVVPYTVFTDPQLGRVGMSERDAAKADRPVRVAKIPMSRVARALETDETQGFMKALVDPDDDRILGAAILGVEGGEIAAVLQVAMMGKLPYTAIRDAAIAHPTFAESLNNLFATLE